MVADIKFCGLTRPEDVAEAATLGASYVGVVFASGPRRLDAPRARDALSAAPPGLCRVGVFGPGRAREIAEVARVVNLDVVQLHGDPTPESVADVRGAFSGRVWAVVRLVGANLPVRIAELASAADALVLDTHVRGALGGTGRTLPWAALDRALGSAFRRETLVLAGGLRPENVAEAIRLLRPGVVDVSSGVETAPGIKDHARMRAFRDAVRDH